MTPDPGQKAWVAGVFDRAASSYDRVGAAYHDHFGQALVEAVAPSPGAAILDVACGLGGVLEQLDAGVLDRIRATAFAHMEPLREESGYQVRLTARLTTATRPS